MTSPEPMIDLAWIVGHRLDGLRRRDHDWLFSFTEGIGLVVSCPWRLLDQGRIRVSADDDGQRFGLSEPIDAERAGADLLEGRPVRSISARPGVLDLVMVFEGDLTLE